MAEETIALTVEIGGAERAINSMKDLKAARKDLQNAFLQGDQDAVKSIKKLDDAMGDLQDATKSVTGEGLEPLRNSFNLFKDGITNLDFGKIGTAFKGLGAAMKAVPIFLLVEGITYLITNFKELSEGTGILAQVLKPIGDLFTWIIDKVYQFTDAIGLTNSELDKMGEAVKTNADKARESLALQTSEYDRQIAVAKAAGKSTVELEKAKQEAIVETNVQIVKQIEAFVRAGGVLDEEKKKLLTASLETIKNAKVQQRVIDETFEKEQKDKAKKAYEENQKKLKEEEEERIKILTQKYQDDADYYANLYKLGVEYAQKRIDYENQLNKTLQEIEAKKAEDAKAAKETELANENAFIMAELQSRQEMSFSQQIEALNAERDLKLQNTKLTEEERLAIIQDYDQKEGDLKQKRFDNIVKLAAQATAAAQAISDTYFAQQLKSAKGNAEKEREIKKKQFNVNKAFGITNAVIDGVRGVNAALAQGPPLGYVFAALTAVMAGINVAQIASAKFDDSGASSGGAGGEIGSMGSVGASAPTITQPNNTVTKLDENGEINKAKAEQPVVKAVVVETDVTDSQKRVNSIKESATF